MMQSLLSSPHLDATWEAGLLDWQNTLLLARGKILKVVTAFVK